MIKKFITIIIAVVALTYVFTLDVQADIMLPEQSLYTGGALSEQYYEYNITGNVTVDVSTTLVQDNKLTITDGSTLYIKNGVTLEINGFLDIQNGGKLVAQKGSTIIINHPSVQSRYSLNYTKINGIFQLNSGSQMLIKQGNVIIEKDGQLHYNGTIEEASDVSDYNEVSRFAQPSTALLSPTACGSYKIGVAGKITKGKNGIRTVKVVKENAKTIILTDFPSIPAMSVKIKELRFDDSTYIKETKQIEKLSKLNALTKLEFYDGSFNDLNMIKGLNNLKTLDLGYTEIQDLSVLLKMKSLSTLIVSDSCLWGENLSVIKNLSGLKVLDLSRSVWHVDDETIDDLKKSLPNTKIIGRDEIFTNIYESFYAKITSETNFRTRTFNLCDENGNIISDVSFRVYEILHTLSQCESVNVTVYFDENGEDSGFFGYDDGDVIKIYYDYRDTAEGLRVWDYAEKNVDYEVFVYAYRVDKVSSGGDLKTIF